MPENICEKHVPQRSTRNVLGCGGDYETVAVLECAACGVLLEYLRYPDYYEDGEAD